MAFQDDLHVMGEALFEYTEKNKARVAECWFSIRAHNVSKSKLFRFTSALEYADEATIGRIGVAVKKDDIVKAGIKLLGVSRETTRRHPPHNMLDLDRFGGTTAGDQKQAKLNTAIVTNKFHVGLAIDPPFESMSAATKKAKDMDMQIVAPHFEARRGLFPKTNSTKPATITFPGTAGVVRRIPDQDVALYMEIFGRWSVNGDGF